jgi:hypothetical protein
VVCGQGRGGQGNSASGEFSAVIAGSLNTASGQEASVVSGSENEVSGVRSSALSGDGNKVTGAASAVSAGTHNRVEGVIENWIGGGRENSINGTANDASILGGQKNTTEESFAAIP